MELNLHLMNTPQREATTHIGGPLLILAGAGSGKTRVITHRIGYMIERGINPKNILAVSFTNKAAREMAERVAKLIGPKLAEKVYMSTFHSLGYDILRQDIDALGYKKPFTILDTADQLRIVQDVYAQINLDKAVIDPKKILSLISRAKMALDEPANLAELKYDPDTRFAQRIFSHYQSALRGRNAVDFDDLISLPVKLFKEHEAVRQRYASRFQYVMIDEYQDTNHTQLMFVHEIVKDHHNLCVVGDDDQSIYGFRGAVADNILQFEHSYPGTRVIMLEQNYRSTSSILEAANGVIAHNKVRKSKALWSANGEGETLRWVECADEREEAEFVAAELERWQGETQWPWRDFAILYRVNPQARFFEEGLRMLDIPYKVVGGQEFYDRSEVRDSVALLRTCLNPLDENSLRRIVNVPPRGLGPVLLERMSDFAALNAMPFFDALRRVSVEPALIEGLGHAGSTKLREFVALVEQFHTRFQGISESGEGSMAETTRELLKRVRFMEYLRESEKSPKIAHRRVQNVEDLLSDIASFSERHGNALDKFLMRITLDRSTQKQEEDHDNAVRLMTYHSSKGLEFPGVFMVGVEERLLPHENNMDKPRQVAEERRLAYVGITRAKQKLCLTSCATRSRYGKKEGREPSRFLKEIPKGMLVRQTAQDADSLVRHQATRNDQYLELARKLFDY